MELHLVTVAECEFGTLDEIPGRAATAPGRVRLTAIARFGLQKRYTHREVSTT